ncbi:midA [Scenedesmus sp. PABB004]|nr:midA [Scenedesmus sp. PABB004]
MGEVLTHPASGYYMARDVFGAAGDFTTSPEISQAFGEVLGVWCVLVWQALGQPARLRLVELGPGRGTLMADLLRGTAGFAGFASALEVHLVEVSPALRRQQWAALRCSGEQQAGAEREEGGHGVCGINGAQVSWHASLDAVPRGAPALFLAHEFLDALPVHQFVRDPRRGWLEVMVDAADEPHRASSASHDGIPLVQQPQQPQQPPPGSPQQPPPGQQDAGLHLRYVLSPGPTPASALLVPRRLAALQRYGQRLEHPDAIEVGARAMAVCETLARRIAADGGAALLVDYGRDAPYANSLTAIRAHGGVHPLSQPGSADLSAWVDFSAMRMAAEEAAEVEAAAAQAEGGGGGGSAAGAAGAPPVAPGVDVHGPVCQADLLHRLGIQARLQQLAQSATPAQAEALVSGYRRLVDTGPGGMGGAYQAMAITARGAATPAGFEDFPPIRAVRPGIREAAEAAHGGGAQPGSGRAGSQPQQRHGFSTSVGGAPSLPPSGSGGAPSLPPSTPPSGSGGRRAVEYGARAPLRREASWVAGGAALLYVASLAFYLFVRIGPSMVTPLHRWYSACLLVVELIGISSVLPYALVNVVHTRPTGSPGLPADSVSAPDKTQVYLLDDGKDAAKAAWLDAAYGGTGAAHYVTGRQRAKGEINGKSANLNHALTRVVYPQHAATPAGIPLGEVVVVFDADMAPRRDFFLKARRAAGARAQRPRPGARVLEVMCDDAVALCLTPQGFHNVHPATDIYNNSNLQFWQYVLPGLDALGCVACTGEQSRPGARAAPGRPPRSRSPRRPARASRPPARAPAPRWPGTNFCLRARALASVGWFPDYCSACRAAVAAAGAPAAPGRIPHAERARGCARRPARAAPAPAVTEDYALSMELKAAGYRGAYLAECLAVGEAPEELRNILRQRSRRARAPARLRWLYSTGTWSYVASVVTTWAFLLVPLISLLFEVQPVAFSRQFALAATLYLGSTALVQGYFSVAEHSHGIWLAGVSNQLLALTYAKAIANTLLSKLRLKKAAGFKPTEKTGAGVRPGGGAGLAIMGRLNSLTRRFNPPPALPRLQQAPQAPPGERRRRARAAQRRRPPKLWALVVQRGLAAWLALPLLWAAHNSVPPLLFFGHLLAGRDALQNMCFWLHIAQVLAGGGAVVCLWFITPAA